MDHRRYLYHARINSRLSLQQIGIRTALSPSVLRNLDEGRYELLPSGVYARSYVRTFAAAVGLDPAVALAEVEHLLPCAPDPLPALTARRYAPEWPIQFFSQLRADIAQRAEACAASIAARTTRVQQASNAALHRVDPWMRSKSASLLDYGVTLRAHPLFQQAGPQLRQCREGAAAAMNHVRQFSENDLPGRVIAGARTIVTRPHEWPGLTRFGAAAVDALLLMVVDAFLVFLISFSSGIPLTSLLRDAGWALGAFCAIPIALYFLLFGGIAGSTLGAYVCSLLPSLAPLSRGDRDTHQPLTLPDILRRAVRR